MVNIKDEKFVLDHSIEKEEKNFKLFFLRKQGEKNFHLLAIYPDHYRLYRPVGKNLPVTRENLKNISFSIEKGEIPEPKFLTETNRQTENLKFNFMVKFKGPGEKWKDISENTARYLLQGHFAENEIEAEILNIKLGTRCETVGAIIEAFADNKK